MANTDDIKQAQVEAGEQTVIERLREKGLLKHSEYEVTEQPLPEGNDNLLIHDLVSKDIQKRKEVGIKRYGQALQANNGRDGLLDAYEEVLDASVYLRQELEERFAVLHYIVKMFNDAGFQMPERDYKQLPAMLGDMQLALRDFESVKAERNTLRRERDGEVWVWQGDEEDHLESLTCPVLIQPEDLKLLIGGEIWEFLKRHDNPPIPMLLFCPGCHKQHIDKAETEMEFQFRVSEHYHDSPLASATSHTLERWTNPPHKSHQCHFCGCRWRPADVPTIGVKKIDTRGSGDNWLPADE